MRNLRSSLWFLAAVAAAFVLTSCATVETGRSHGPATNAPTLRIGDRWVYSATDGYRVPVVWEETHEVTAIGSEGIIVSVTLRGPAIDLQRTETWTAPGVVRSGAVYEAETDRFDPSLIRYKFPLTPGDSWRQTIRDTSKEPGPFGPIQRHVSVGGYESVTTPAGTFDAIRMRVIMRVDDETTWQTATECNYLVWYAPAVSAVVKEQKHSSYRNKGWSAGMHPGQNATLVLTSFTRGR